MSLCRRNALPLLLGLALICGICGPAAAFHFPWDQGHDTFRPGDPPDDNDPDDQNCNGTASPFEVSTGNFVETLPVLYIASFGPDIDLTLTYNSRDNRRGQFGHGWSHTYDLRLAETTDGVTTTAICHEGSGKRERFVRDAGGAYVSPPDLFSTLNRNPDGSYTLRLKTGTVRRYDAFGRLIALIDRNGNQMSFDYDATGFLTRLSDASGRQVDFTKGADGRVAQITDPAGRLFSFEYDLAANLSAFVDANGDRTEYVYDSANNLLVVEDPRGNNERVISYDSAGRTSSYTEGAETYTITYDPANKRTFKRDSSNRQWTYTYNDNGNVVGIVDPLGTTETYVYNSSFYIAQVTDKNGETSSFTYDARGNLTSYTDPESQTATYTYEPVFDQLATVVEPDGSTTTHVYDANGNLISVTDALGSQMTFSWDSKGQLVSATDARGGTTQLSYDEFGNIIRTTDPTGRTILSSYDAIGTLLLLTDAEGRSHAFGFDAKRRLITETEPTGATTGYAYDGNDNVLSITHASGGVTSFSYDQHNRMTQVTNPVGEVIQKAYDSHNNLISETVPGGTLSFAYDAVGRLTQKNLPGETVTLSYDGAGNVVAITDSKSSLTFEYDGLNRPVRVTTAATAFQPQTEILYSYDARGNRASMTDPSGGVTTYAYDALRRLTSMTDPAGDTTTYGYDASSQRSSIGRANGVTSSLAYNPAQDLLQISSSVGASSISSYQYTYDGIGNRLTLTDLDGLHSFAYDALNRLTAATHPTASNPAESFSYDPVGNRTSSHLSAAYTYDAANRLLQDDSFSYTYDGRGNLTSRTSLAASEVTQYTYDLFNRLTRVDLPAGGVVLYTYDALGRRIQKAVDGTITRYVYDDEDILLEYDGANAVLARYTHGPGYDDVVSMARGGQTYYYTTDGVGSTRELTDATGAVVASYLYDSFGNTVATTGSVVNPYQFTGREFDPETGFYYNRSRYYDPATGRFIGEDPAGFFDGLNLYTYANGNPVLFVDPSGQFLQYVVGAGVSVATGFILAKLTGTCYTWKDAFIDAGTGALGVGIVSKGRKLLRIRKLRQIAKSRGMTNTGRKGYVEPWKHGPNPMDRLNIKFEPAKRAKHPDSLRPRFDFRTGPGQYWDPFTGKVGPKGALSHVPLEPALSPGVSAGVGAGTGAVGGAARTAGNSECECN